MEQTTISALLQQAVEDMQRQPLQQDIQAIESQEPNRFENPRRSSFETPPKCFGTESLAMSVVKDGNHSVVSAEDQHDRQILKMLNPDYVRVQTLDMKAQRVMLLKEQSLKSTFSQESNARLWLYSQIMKCAMMSSTIVPEAQLVNDFASAILQMYGSRPIAHIAIFFGYAQVGQHFFDEYEMEHFGVFDLSHLLNDLARHMRIVSCRAEQIRKKKQAHDEEIKRWEDIVEGRTITYAEWLATLSPEARDKAIAVSGPSDEDVNSEEWKLQHQARIDYAKHMLEILKNTKDY